MSASQTTRFTIFTPCYNGALTISRVFASVESQTFSDFEWIIVNDGSTDDSDQVIRSLIKACPLKDKITYIKQENIGKHRTWNHVVDMARGEIFVPADCDDSFLPETLAFFDEKMSEIVQSSKEKILNSCGYSGVNVCVYDPVTNKMMGTPYPRDGLVSDNLELNFKYKIQGEHWGCIRTDLLRKYKFPEIRGHFFAETRIWYALALDGYKVKCFNRPLRAYYQVPTSLCNNVAYKHDPSRAYMALLFSGWLIRRGWFRIARLNLPAALKLLTVPIRALVRMAMTKI